MIDQLNRDLRATKVPSRLLDCELHECILGEIDMQTDREATGECSYWSRQMAREHGDMLVDLGSERRRIRVPLYTREVEEAVKLLPRDSSWALSYIPYIHPAFTNPAFNIAERYAVIVRDEDMEPIWGETSDLSMAHAVCLLAVKIALNGLPAKEKSIVTVSPRMLRGPK